MGSSILSQRQNVRIGVLWRRILAGRLSAGGRPELLPNRKSFPGRAIGSGMRQSGDRDSGALPFSIFCVRFLRLRDCNTQPWKQLRRFPVLPGREVVGSERKLLDVVSTRSLITR